MAVTQSLQTFLYTAADDLASGAAGDNATVFTAVHPVEVVECGVLITTNLVPGAASVDLIEFDITTASVGPTGAEVTAPGRLTASATIVTSSSNVTHQDGKCLSVKTDFRVEKGETLTAQVLGGTSGNGTPYIIYRATGVGIKEVAEQRSGEAAE